MNGYIYIYVCLYIQYFASAGLGGMNGLYIYLCLFIYFVSAGLGGMNGLYIFMFVHIFVIITFKEYVETITACPGISSEYTVNRVNQGTMTFNLTVHVGHPLSFPSLKYPPPHYRRPQLKGYGGGGGVFC